MQLIERTEHPRRDVALDHGRLDRVAVDQHRGVERLEAADAERVKDTGPDDPEVVRAVRDAANDLLLSVGRELADTKGHLDLHVAVRLGLDSLEQVVDSRVIAGFAVHGRHPEDDGSRGTAGLVPCLGTAAGGTHGRGQNQGQCLEKTSHVDCDLSPRSGPRRIVRRRCAGREDQS